MACLFVPCAARITFELYPWRCGQTYHGIFICGQRPQPSSTGQKWSNLPSELKFHYHETMHKVLQILLMPLQGAQTYSNLTQTYSMMLKPICSMLGGLFTDCWVALLSEVIMLTSDDHFCGRRCPLCSQIDVAPTFVFCACTL